MAVTLGLYRHFKGHLYLVIGIARHSESLEDHVVYVSRDDPTDMWVRPASMFEEVVEKEGRTFPRFEKVQSDDRLE